MSKGARSRMIGSDAGLFGSLAVARPTDAGLLDQALTRAAGAPLVGGNKVRMLHDAAEHYPAWLEAIRTAERTIFFESYIVHEDEWGAEFADALAERPARESGSDSSMTGWVLWGRRPVTSGDG